HFSVSIGSPCVQLICSASRRAWMSAAPPGGSALTLLIVRAACDHAPGPVTARREKETAAKVAAPTAQFENCQCGSFIAVPRGNGGVGSHRVEAKIHSSAPTAV